MREILFRGKRTDSGEWVEGYYVVLYDYRHDRHSYRIYTGMAESDCEDLYPDWYEVDPESVGQYTGLTDMNGEKIFEGDILKHPKGGMPMLVKFGFYTDMIHGRIYAEEYGWHKVPLPISIPLPFYENDIGRQKEIIIGNIYDNPDLMEEDT